MSVNKGVGENEETELGEFRSKLQIRLLYSEAAETEGHEAEKCTQYIPADETSEKLIKYERAIERQLYRPSTSWRDCRE